MNIFNELSEIDDLKENQKKLTDNLLDLYKKNPEECSRLLKELNEIYSELDDLEAEFLKIQNEIC
jgi:predicted  nucleic acid-binding Zn-ribbon protein